MSPIESAFTRRAMLVRSAQAAAAAGLAACHEPLQAAPASGEAAPPVIWDAHCHLTGAEGTPEQRASKLLKLADRMGIERLIFFLGASRVPEPSPAQLREDNAYLLRAIKAAPDRILGFVYLNPQYVEASLQEVERYVADGPMVGIKLWIAMHCNHRNLDPICRRAVELKAPILQHTYWRTEPTVFPGESIPPDLAELGLRHPGVTIIAAHTGNDWERGIRAIRVAKNVYAETSGFDPTAGMVDMAVRELGAERVVYGSDIGGRSFASQMAKVVGADIPDAAKRLILAGNLRRVMEPILNSKGIRL